MTDEIYFVNHCHKKLQATVQSKENTAQSYQKVLNENNTKKNYGTEFVFLNCEIDNLGVSITHFYFISIFKP